MTQTSTNLAAHALAYQPGRSASLSWLIVSEVRQTVLAGQMRAGAFLGTENDLAERYGVSRIVARDALRTLEAMGVVTIRMGKGGGARIARGNPLLFAEAMAVQFALSGVAAAEIMDAQRALETAAVGLAADNADADDLARLSELLDEAERHKADAARFTALGRDFHLALAEASKNRVFAAQLASLQHVSWPARNPTFTPALADRVLAAHRALLEAVKQRDAAKARALMEDHVGMIRARRVAEHAHDAGVHSSVHCC